LTLTLLVASIESEEPLLPLPALTEIELAIAAIIAKRVVAIAVTEIVLVATITVIE
jgi:hypothetical protein